MHLNHHIYLQIVRNLCRLNQQNQKVNYTMKWIVNSKCCNSSLLFLHIAAHSRIIVYFIIGYDLIFNIVHHQGAWHRYSDTFSVYTTYIL